MSIAVGQKAPDFTLQNQDKKEVKLSDFAGKKNVVLVWYPLDWSPDDGLHREDWVDVLDLDGGAYL